MHYLHYCSVTNVDPWAVPNTLEPYFNIPPYSTLYEIRHSLDLHFPPL